MEGIRSKPQSRIFHGWWIVFAALMTTFSGIGVASQSFTVLLKYLYDEFGWSRGSISGAKSLLLLVSAGMGPIFGKGIDLFDPRWMIIPSAVLMGFAFMLLSQMTTLWHFYFLYFMAGIGFVALNTQAMAPVISRWFHRKRGIAIGIAGLGPSTAGIIAIPLVNYAFSSVGWRNGCIIMGALVVIITGVIVGSLMKRRPEDMGLLPDGISPHPSGMGGVSPQGVVVAKENSSLSHSSSEEGLTTVEAFKTRDLWLLIIAYFLIHMTMLATTVHFFSFFTDLGLSKGKAAALFSVKSMIGLGGHLLIGWLADIFNRKYIAAFSYLFMGIGFFLLFSIETTGNLSLVYPFLLIYGLGYGGKTTMEFVLIAEVFGTRSMGTISGFIRIARTGGGALGPVLAGYIFDIYGGYRWAFLLFTFCCILGSILIAFTRPQMKRS